MAKEWRRNGEGTHDLQDDDGRETGGDGDGQVEGDTDDGYRDRSVPELKGE